jgi:4-hydroxy-tetrahydrodipicolinate synthase
MLESAADCAIMALPLKGSSFTGVIGMFTGVFTAIVTPFDADGAVDYGCLRALIDRQAAAGVDGIVPVGTTGESPTLSYDEHSRVIDETIEACRGRMKVIAGTGANSTSEALELTRRAKDAGADGTLQVTPYYNKPNQEGLYRHFSAIADLGLPVMLYNVPGRSGREIAIETIVRLSEHPSIVGVKEAAGCVDRVSLILSQCSTGVLSGDDALTLPMMAAGADGVISVASNLIPEVMVSMVGAAREGRWDAARELHLAYHRVFSDLFLDTNPIPVKAAMAMNGLCQETYRLPLCEMHEGLKSQLRETLEVAGVL